MEAPLNFMRSIPMKKPLQSLLVLCLASAASLKTTIYVPRPWRASDAAPAAALAPPALPLSAAGPAGMAAALVADASASSVRTGVADPFVVYW